MTSDTQTHAETPNIAEIERRLQGIVSAVRDERERDLDELVAGLGQAIQSLAGDSAAGASAQELDRVQALWKQASLALASAGQATRSQIKHTSTGRRCLKTYRQ